MDSQSQAANVPSAGTRSVTGESEAGVLESETSNLPVFPRESAIWRVSREQVLLLGGPAAAILQVAHPQVAHGVAAHSDFRNDSLGRLLRTLDAVYTVTFSPRRDVEAMAQRVRAVHARVRGERPAAYSAFAPEAQMWVLATLIALSVKLYERFVAKLSERELAAFYRDMRVFGAYFGLETGYGPANWEAFIAYYREKLEDPEMGSLPLSSELAWHVAHPGRPLILRPLWPCTGFLARHFTPSPVRERLGFFETGGTRAAAAILDALLPAILRRLPAPIRYVGKYRAALRRL